MFQNYLSYDLCMFMILLQVEHGCHRITFCCMVRLKYYEPDICFLQKNYVLWEMKGQRLNQVALKSKLLWVWVIYEEFCPMGYNAVWSVISQKIELFITTPVRTLNPSWVVYIYLEKKKFFCELLNKPHMSSVACTEWKMIFNGCGMPKMLFVLCFCTPALQNFKKQGSEILQYYYFLWNLQAYQL
jgi:hypothetical protein